MAAGKIKSFDEIDDIGEMFEAMAALDSFERVVYTARYERSSNNGYNRPVFKIAQLECRTGKNLL